MLCGGRIKEVASVTDMIVELGRPYRMVCRL